MVDGRGAAEPRADAAAEEEEKAASTYCLSTYSASRGRYMIEHAVHPPSSS